MRGKKFRTRNFFTDFFRGRNLFILEKFSSLEKSETLEDEKLESVAKVLGVTKEAIENFSDDAVFNYFNNFSDNSINQGPIGPHNICNFNPLDKVVELYERLIQAEKDKVAYLEKLLKK